MSSSKLIYLYVPISEKEKVKSIGAKWHSGRRQWFITSEMDAAPFKEWIPILESNFNTRAISPFYLLKSKESCWKCGELSSVITFAADGVESKYNEKDRVMFNYISFLPERLSDFVGEIYKNYFIDYSKTTNSHYYINHCEHCTAVLGDFFMHMEPGNAFFPQSDEEASSIEVIQLKENGFVKLNTKTGYGVVDSIIKNGKFSIYNPEENS